MHLGLSSKFQARAASNGYMICSLPGLQRSDLLGEIDATHIPVSEKQTTLIPREGEPFVPTPVRVVLLHDLGGM